MTPDEVIAKISAAMEPPTNCSAKPTKPIYGVLFGAGVSLIRCYEILRASDSLGEVWSPEQLYADLTDTLARGRKLDFERTETLRTWSFGFFLNKSHLNIATLLDRMVSRWIESRDPKSITPRDRESLHHTYIDSRLWILYNWIEDAECKELILQLRTAFGDLWHDTVRAEEHLEGIHKATEGDPRPEQCVALEVARANAFKHLPEGILVRPGLRTELGVATKAFFWLVTLVQLMLKEITAWEGMKRAPRQ